MHSATHKKYWDKKRGKINSTLVTHQKLIMIVLYSYLELIIFNLDIK